MKVAGIVIESWKLKIFKKTLDAKEYKYTVHDEQPWPNHTVIKVEIYDVVAFTVLVKEMQQMADNSKLN